MGKNLGFSETPYLNRHLESWQIYYYSKDLSSAYLRHKTNWKTNKQYILIKYYPQKQQNKTKHYYGVQMLSFIYYLN